MVKRREGGGGPAAEGDEDLETSEWRPARHRADVVHAEVADALGLRMRTELSVEAGEEGEVGDDRSRASTGVNVVHVVDHREGPEGSGSAKGLGRRQP